MSRADRLALEARRNARHNALVDLVRGAWTMVQVAGIVAMLAAVAWMTVGFLGSLNSWEPWL